MVAKVITVSQGKGGIAKTTTSVNLAGSLIELGFKVILTDWDTDKPDALTWSKKNMLIDWVAEIGKDATFDALEGLKKNYDFVICDTPPNFEKGAYKAIMASDYIIIPSSTNELDQAAAESTIEMVRHARKPFMVLMSRLKKGTRSGKDTFNSIDGAKGLFKTIITERQVVADAPTYGKWIGQFAKNSESHKQFLSLAREVVQLVGIEYDFCCVDDEVIGQ